MGSVVVHSFEFPIMLLKIAQKIENSTLTAISECFKMR